MSFWGNDHIFGVLGLQGWISIGVGHILVLVVRLLGYISACCVDVACDDSPFGIRLLGYTSPCCDGIACDDGPFGIRSTCFDDSDLVVFLMSWYMMMMFQLIDSDWS